MSQGLGRLFFGLIMPIVLTYMFLGPTAVEILRPPVRDILPPPNSIFPSNSYGAVPSERSTVFIVVPNADGLSGEAPCTPGSSTKAQVLLGVAQQLQEKLSDVGVEAFIVAAEGQNARGQYFLQSRQADVCLVLGAGDCAKPSGFCICSGRDKASAESERLVRAITASYARATANKIAPATQCQCSRDLARAVALDPTNGVPASTPGVAVELGSMGADIFVLESQSGGAILAQGLAEGVLSFLVEGNRLQPPWPYSGDLVRDEQEHVIGSQDVYQQEAPRGPMQSRGSAIRPTPTPPVTVVSTLESGVPFDLINVATGKPLQPQATFAGVSQAGHGDSSAPSRPAWRLQGTGRYHRIVHVDTGHCLSAAQASRSNGIAVVCGPVTGGDHELWELRTVSGGVQLVAKHSWYCLEIIDGKAVQTEPSDRASQLWMPKLVCPMP